MLDSENLVKLVESLCDQFLVDTDVSTSDEQSVGTLELSDIFKAIATVAEIADLEALGERLEEINCYHYGEFIP